MTRRPSALKGSGTGCSLRLPRSVSWSDEVAGGSLAEVKEFEPQPQEHWWGDWQEEGGDGKPPALRGCACCLM